MPFFSWLAYFRDRALMKGMASNINVSFLKFLIACGFALFQEKLCGVRAGRLAPGTLSSVRALSQPDNHLDHPFYLRCLSLN